MHGYADALEEDEVNGLARRGSASFEQSPLQRCG
jgi:hypothetical protein